MAPGLNPFIQIGKDTYFISFDPHANRLPPSLTRKIRRLEGEFILASAVEWTPSAFTPADLEATCKHFTNSDDVWTTDFLECKFFVTEGLVWLTSLSTDMNLQ